MFPPMYDGDGMMFTHGGGSKPPPYAVDGASSPTGIGIKAIEGQ